MTRSRRPHNITQGEYAVCRGQDKVITTLLGSCVCACLWDSGAGIGGMNHILLPRRARAIDRLSTGANEMEILINKLLVMGGQKAHLQAKVFGGAHLSDKLGNFGASNISFVMSFLKNEGIPVIASDTGGCQGRLIRFWPASGLAQVKRCIDVNEDEFVDLKARKPKAGVELF